MTAPPPVQWVGYHLAELAGVTVPLALAATETPWLAALAVPVAGWWTHHEIRLYRQRRAARQHLAITSNTIDAEPTFEANT